MKASTIIILIAIHASLFLAATSLFIVLFHTGLFSNIDIFFYRGIMLLLVTCFVLLTGLFLLKRKQHIRIFTYRDVILSVVITFSFNIVFFTHIPVTADRSLSIFILGYMNEHARK